MKKNNIQYVLFRTIVFLLCVFVTVLIVYYSRNCTFLFGDDGYSSLYPHFEEGIFDCLSFRQHGDGYIGLFLTKFLCFGFPNLMGLHPADFIGIPHGFIRGIFTSIIFLMMTNFVVFFRKSNLLYLMVFIILIIKFFNYIADSASAILMCNYNYYRYFFSLLFISIFYNYILQNILLAKKKNNYKKLILASISGFVIGTSIEINIFFSVIFVFLIYLYSFFVNKLIKDRNILKTLTLYLDKNFHIPSLALFAASILVVTQKDGFQHMAGNRGLGETTISISLIKSFVNEYWNIYFIDNALMHTILLVLILISVLFAIKRKEINKILFPLFFMSSIYITIFSLIFLGKTNYDGDFWLTHPNIIFLFRMLIIYPILYCSSYVYKNLEVIKLFNKSKIKNFICLLIIVLLLNPLVKIPKQYDGFDATFKRKAYIMEKLLRFYYLRNERAILPKNAILLHDFDPWTSDVNAPYYIGNQITDSYYPRIYKDEKSRKLGYELNNNAMNMFYKLGGSFSKEELEDIKFARLFNEDFVLNKKYKPNEIDKILE